MVPSNPASSYSRLSVSSLECGLKLRTCFWYIEQQWWDITNRIKLHKADFHVLASSLALWLPHCVAGLWAAGRSGLRDWEWSWDWGWSLANNHWTSFCQKWHECVLRGCSCHSWALWSPTPWLLESFLVRDPEREGQPSCAGMPGPQKQWENKRLLF